jgi:hypothetical protein
MIVPDAFGDPARVARLMRGYPHRWGICGGWAIDLLLNRVTRHHKDVEIAVWRRDQLVLRSHLASRGWMMEKAVKGGFEPWREGEYIELPVHGLWCRNPDHDPDFLEVLLNEADEERFLFRRDMSISLDIGRAFVWTESGLPILAPEIVLLYKAKPVGDEVNEADFRVCLPHLDASRRAWLENALQHMYPGHPWLDRLKNRPPQSPWEGYP